MASGRRVVIEFIGEDKSLSKTIKGVEGSTSTLGSKLKSFGKVAAAGFAVVGAAAVKGSIDAIGAASDLNETISKSNTIFGKNAGAMEKWASGAARTAGLSKQAALSAAAGFGDMFSQIGFTGDQAAKMSKQVVQMSADLGSFNNLDTADVADRMSAAFRGEYDSLQALVPNINAARVESQALAMTGKKTVKELTAQEKASAVLAIVNKDGARAMGDFERTSGGLANQQKILRAQLENVQAAIGQKLLPVAVKLFTWFNDKGLPAMQQFGGYLQRTLPPIFEKVRAVVSRVMGALRGDVGGNMSGIRQVFRDAVTIIQRIWSLFGKNIVQYLKSTFKNLKTVLKGAFQVIRGIFRTVAALLKGDWKGAWEGIKTILRGASKVLLGIVRQMWNLIRFAFKNAGVALRGIFRAAWDGIRSIARNGASWLVDQIKSIPGRFLNSGRAFLKAGRTLINKLWEGVRSAAGNASNFVGDLLARIKSGINNALDLPLTVSLPKALGGKSYTVIPAFAKGTDFAPGGWALVGEKGPELVNLPRGAGVTPHGESMAALRGSGGGGGDTYVFNISGVVGNEDALARKIEQMLAKRNRVKGPLAFRTI